MTRQAVLGELPDGAMVRYQGGLALRADEALLPWSFAGYGPPLRPSPDVQVELLTPPAIVGVLLAGYQPLVHPSAGPTSMRAFR